MPEPVATRDTGYSVNGTDVSSKRQAFDALYVPPQQRPNLAPVRSLVLPTAQFSPGRMLMVKLEGLNHQIRLAVTIEQTREWVWTTYEPLVEPPPPP